jgi:class 3 adenylate cyclase
MLNFMRSSLILSICAVIIGLFPLPSLAFSITDGSQVSFKVPNSEINILEENLEYFNIEDVLKNKFTFKSLSEISDLKTNRQYWMVTKLENKSSIDKQLIFDKLPNWEKFKAYIVKKDGKVEVIEKNQSSYSSMINPSVGNNLVKITTDQFDSRYAQFNLSRDESITVYVYVKANHHFKHPDLSINFADYPKYLELKRQSLYFEGVLLGAILSLLIFSIYNALIFKDLTSICYASWLFFSCLLPISLSMLDGQRLNEFLIDTRDLKIFGIEFNFFVLYVAGCFQNILYVLFSLFFLNIKSQYPSIDKTLKIYCLLVTVFYSFQLFVHYDFDANILWVPFYTTHVAVLLLILGCGINNSIKGQTSANFFNIALVPYVLFRIFYSLGIVKWWSPLSLLSDSGLFYFLKSSAGVQQVLSISLEAVIMSLAVAHRSKALQDAVSKSIQDQKKFIEEQNKTLDLTVTQRTLELNAKKANIQELLYNMMPMSIAKELEFKGSSPPIRHDSVTILFTDFVGFTQASSIMPANRMVSELNEIFGEFDRIIQECGVEKIKTIGDSYMAVAGAPTYCEDHALRCAKAALGIIKYIESRNSSATFKWSLRVGLHSGPVVAGVIGNKRITYDIWGDSVNLASRMESASEANRVNISAYTFDLIRDQIKCEYRGKIPVKGKGEIDMYFISV